MRKESPSAKSFKDLHGKKLSYMKGWLYQTILEKEHPEIDLVLNDRIEGLIGQVLLGTVDAGLIDLQTLAFFAKKHHIRDLKVVFTAPKKIEVAFGVRKDWPLMAKMLNKAINSISATEKAKLEKKWLYADTEPIISLKAILSLLGLIAVIFFWNFQLRKQVRIRTKDIQTKAEQIKSKPVKSQIRKRIESSI